MRPLAIYFALALSTASSFAGADEQTQKEESADLPPAGTEAADSPSQPTDENPGDTEPAFVPPTLTTPALPVYPERAKQEGLEAEVVLEIDLDIQGLVEGVSVAVPAAFTGYGFEESATEAAWSLVFSPALEGDEAVPVRITYKFSFSQDQAIETNTDSSEDPTVASTPVADVPKVVNFQGRVLERGTRKPIVGAKVVVLLGALEDQVAFESTTQKDGSFEFLSLDQGEWKVISDPAGYYPLRTTEKITETERTEVTYHIERQSYNEYDVLVESKRPRKEVSRTTITVEEIEKIPGTFGDVLGVVQNLPGVARTGAGPGRIVVRGSSPEDTKIFIDGVNVPLIYHFGGLRSVVPLGMLELVDFYPGNFSAYYGRAIGGILDVKTKTRTPEKASGYLDVNVFDAGFFLETPLGDKGSIALAGRRSYIDGILNAAVPDDADVGLVTAPRYYDYQLLTQYRPTNAHEFRLFVFGSDDKLQLLFENPAEINPLLTDTRLSTSTTFYRTMLEYKYVPNKYFENTIKMAQGRNWIDLNLGDQYYFRLNTYSAQIRDTARIKLNRAFTLMVGLDYLFTKTDADISLPPVSKEGESGGPDLSDVLATSTEGQAYHSVGSFVEAEFTPTEKLLFTPGFRYDYFSRLDKSAFAPRLSARYAITDQWTAKGGVGLFHQEPQFDESNEVFGNPNLGLESAIHYSVGVEYRPLPQLTIDTTLFYKDMNNLVSRSDAMVERDGQQVPENFNNNGEGRVYGIELLARHEFANNFYGWVSYTLSRAERRDTGSDNYRLFDYDQTHILTILGSYRLPKNWEIGARWRLVTGKPNTPIEGGTYNVDAASYSPIYGSTNSERIAPFHQLDIRIDKKWIFDSWMLSAYLDIQNVYNRANPEGYSYNYDYTERKVRSGLPLIPVIGVKGEF